ncbi:MAG: hypothetical protein HOC09_28395, partial [Deltaproteobacteria bacterium]|nr:hypothetical protein [Deltaproteobacteria bacterium]
DKQLQDFTFKINNISDSQKQLKNSAESLGSYAKKIGSVQTELASKTHDFSNTVNQIGRIATEIDTETQAIKTNTHNFKTEYQSVANAAGSLNKQVEIAEQMVLRFSGLISSLLSNDSGSTKTNQGLEEIITELRKTLTQAIQTLDNFRELGEKVSSTLISNGDNIKSVLKNIIQDTNALENEIRARLKEIRDQRDQTNTKTSDPKSSS